MAARYRQPGRPEPTAGRCKPWDTMPYWTGRGGTCRRPQRSTASWPNGPVSSTISPVSPVAPSPPSPACGDEVGSPGPRPHRRGAAQAVVAGPARGVRGGAASSPPTPAPPRRPPTPALALGWRPGSPALRGPDAAPVDVMKEHGMAARGRTGAVRPPPRRAVVRRRAEAVAEGRHTSIGMPLPCGAVRCCPYAALRGPTPRPRAAPTEVARRISQTRRARLGPDTPSDGEPRMPALDQHTRSSPPTRSTSWSRSSAATNGRSTDAPTPRWPPKRPASGATTASTSPGRARSAPCTSPAPSTSRCPSAQRRNLFELLALANERLWIGHFGMDPDDGMPLFRHSVLLRGAPGASVESLEDMVDIAHHRVRAVLSGLPVRAVGRQDANRSAAVPPCWSAPARRDEMKAKGFVPGPYQRRSLWTPPLENRVPRAPPLAGSRGRAPGLPR